MSPRSSLPPKKEKLIEFLSEDFRDTASHLRDTDRKIEFTFQLYAGSFSILSSIIISFLAFAYEGQNWITENFTAIMITGLFLLSFLWLFTWWAFMYTIRGTKMKAMYINRMNFLRHEVYKQLGVKISNNPVFYYTNKFLPTETLKKVGMVDMFPLGLRWAMFLLPFPIFVLFYNTLISFKLILHWAFWLIPFIVAAGVWMYTKIAWVKIVKDTQDKIEKSWDAQN